MDEMKIKLTTRFMKGVISKIIKRSIYKKYGCNVDIHINEIDLKNDEEKIHLHIDVDSEMSNVDFAKFLRDVGLD